jgi:O-6-methylguanine DNA methyltransferase
MRASSAKQVRLRIATRDGDFLAAYSDAGLARLDFPGDGKPGKSSSPARVLPFIGRWHRIASAALKFALAGRAPGKLPPLDLSAGTAFQQAVWLALQKIRPGATRSYGQISRLIGRPGAARAVGGACGANPIPVLIPCHRVLAAGGRLGGFSGGLDWKRRLLEMERAQMATGMRLPRRFAQSEKSPPQRLSQFSDRL